MAKSYGRCVTCESCGSDDGKTTEVRRVYVTPEAWDSEGSVTPVAETEQWCDACVLHYPHQSVEEAEGQSADA